MWFDNWSDVLRVFIIGSAAYVTLILLLRLTGKRSLSQLNAFDFIVTVALGSTFATILLSTDVSWAEGASALGLLLVLQLVVAFFSARSDKFRSAITAEPVVLLDHGEFQRDAMKDSRVGESEILQAIRSSGSGSVSKVAAVVLETNGKFSVIPDSKFGDGSAIRNTRQP